MHLLIRFIELAGVIGLAFSALLFYAVWEARTRPDTCDESGWEFEDQDFPPRIDYPARPWNPGGNSHQRKVARRKLARAQKLGNA